MKKNSWITYHKKTPEITETIAFITLCESNWTAEEIRALYRLGFCIKTYYRMMRRF